jgi:hypothetical protein
MVHVQRKAQGLSLLGAWPCLSQQCVRAHVPRKDLRPAYLGCPVAHAAVTGKWPSRCDLCRRNERQRTYGTGSPCPPANALSKPPHELNRRGPMPIIVNEVVDAL